MHQHAIPQPGLPKNDPRLPHSIRRCRLFTMICPLETNWWNERRHRRLPHVYAGWGLAAIIAGLITMPYPTRAATAAAFNATAVQPLKFGTLVTASGGSRTVATDGSTTNNGVFPLGDSTSGPAEFTMTYRRAPGDLLSYLLIFQFSLPAPPIEAISGIQGSLSGFTTDLPGVPTLQPGQTAIYVLPNCMAASCSVTFHVGGTLTITRSSGGGTLNFPLTLLATITTVLG